MRNFFKPNNSDGGQNPSRRNSEQTNLSENIATIRRTGVNTMTARKSIYTITAAISVALIATVALVSIGIVGGQSAPNNLSNLDHHLPSCSGADDSITCSTGRIYAVNQLSGLTSESVATGTNLDYQTPEALVWLRTALMSRNRLLCCPQEGVATWPMWGTTIASTRRIVRKTLVPPASSDGRM